MASFQAKIGWKWPRKRLKYKLSFRFVPTQCVIKTSKQNSKQILKIIKKLLWLLFKQKLVGNDQERDKNTNYRFVSFLPNA